MLEARRTLPTVGVRCYLSEEVGAIMSGSGGSGDVGGGAFGAPEAPDCATLRVIVTLSNPQPDVVAELEEGQRLAVERREHAGHTQVAVVTDDGRLAGW